jgi:hypothetical protein
MKITEYFIIFFSFLGLPEVPHFIASKNYLVSEIMDIKTYILHPIGRP